MKTNPFFSKLNLLAIGIGASIGAAGGGLYYKVIGCRTGACPLTSRLGIMLVYGALVGGIIGSLAADLIAKKRASAERKAAAE